MQLQPAAGGGSRLHAGSVACVIVVVSVINDGNDVRSGFQHGRHLPVARIEDGEIRLLPYHAQWSDYDYLLDFSSLFTLWRHFTSRDIVTESGDGAAIVAECLSVIKAEADKSGANSLFVIQHSLEPNTAVPYTQAAKACGLDACDISQKLSAEHELGHNLLLSDGIHWNPTGHRFVANVILELLRPR